METTSDDAINIAELLNKCRLCFRAFEEDRKFVTLDETIKQKFFMLTSLRVSLFCDF